MTSPLTIVIPVRNRAHTLPRLLKSIDAQTLAPAAVVLVDNASTDTSLRVMTEWASTRGDVTVVSEPRPGACAARNRGLAEVATEWTMFFDSDDEMLPTHIEDFSRAITADPRGDIFGRGVIYRSGSRDTVKPYLTRSALFLHLFTSILSTQRYVARTELFRSVGGWDESLPGWNDYEIGVRLLLTHPRLATVPGAPSVIVHSHPDSITGESYSAHPDRWERSLETVRRDLQALGSPRLTDWIDARGMILAAAYAVEGRNDLAESLRERILQRTRHPRRMKLFYMHNLRFRRFTWLLVRLLLP